MKSERRHELKTNVLSEWLSHQIEAIRPYANLILVGIVAIVAAAAVSMFLVNDRANRLSAAWTDYFSASSQDNPDRLRTVAEAHAGTLPGLWALQSEADIELARGIQALYTNRSEASEALERAKTLYGEVATDARSEGLLLRGAWFGLAQANECSNDLDEARDYYQKVIDNAPDSALATEAQQRLELLENENTVAWLKWFADQKPRPATPAAGAIPGLDLPVDLGDLSDRPDLSIPGGATVPLTGPATPTEQPTGTDTASPTTPEKPTSDAGTPPAEEKPAEEKPAEEKPADEKPAEDKPAEDKPAEENPAEEKPADAPAADEPASDPPADNP